MKLVHFGVIAAIAATLTVGVPLAPGAAASSAPAATVPKGTPYAAEVITSIGMTAVLTVTTSETVKDVCEAQSASSSYTETMKFLFGGSYPQVTVPVATYQQLGRAYARLHVDPTPTSSGRGGLESGFWTVVGKAPKSGGATSKTDCSSQPFHFSGTFKSASSKVTVRTELVHNAALGDPGPADVVVNFFDLSGDAALEPEPATWAIPGQAPTNMNDELGTISSNLPELEIHQAHDLGEVMWDSLVLASAPQAYAPLVNQGEVELPVLRSQGAIGCGTGKPNGTTEYSCRVDYYMSASVILHKRFLYRTQRAYAR